MKPVVMLADANVFLRFLRNDHPEHSPAAKEVIEQAADWRSHSPGAGDRRRRHFLHAHRADDEDSQGNRRPPACLAVAAARH